MPRYRDCMRMAFDDCILLCVPVKLISGTVWSGCTNERAAAAGLGYTPFSWDNFSGKEPQPPSADKSWSELTNNEKAAARVLGYTGKIWDNESGLEAQAFFVNKNWPAFYKYWPQLTSCGNFRSEDVFFVYLLFFP